MRWINRKICISVATLALVLMMIGIYLNNTQGVLHEVDLPYIEGHKVQQLPVFRNDPYLLDFELSFTETPESTVNNRALIAEITTASQHKNTYHITNGETIREGNISIKWTGQGWNGRTNELSYIFLQLENQPGRPYLITGAIIFFSSLILAPFLKAIITFITRKKQASQ